MQTSRLSLRQLTLDDAPFILELLNEPGFIQYIGDKDVRTIVGAENYLTTGPLASYEKNGFGLMAVELLPQSKMKMTIGLCGLVQRESLPGPDLGYAFLARYCGQGYAIEAAQAVMQNTLFPRVLAITAPDNDRSIRLLLKLGFQFEKLMEMGKARETVKLFAWTGG